MTTCFGLSDFACDTLREPPLMETSENSVRVFCLECGILPQEEGSMKHFPEIFLLSQLALGAVHYSLAEAVSRRQNVLEKKEIYFQYLINLVTYSVTWFVTSAPPHAPSLTTILTIHG